MPEPVPVIEAIDYYAEPPNICRRLMRTIGILAVIFASVQLLWFVLLFYDGFRYYSISRLPDASVLVLLGMLLILVLLFVAGIWGLLARPAGRVLLLVWAYLHLAFTVISWSVWIISSGIDGVNLVRFFYRAFASGTAFGLMPSLSFVIIVLVVMHSREMKRL